MSLSTHILDTALGRPAANVAITLLQLDGEAWHEIGNARTDADGRCKDLLGDRFVPTTQYKLRFHTAPSMR
jgi:5-hydroxyisourate hydrolase